jgi:hypothetical protein
MASASMMVLPGTASIAELRALGVSGLRVAPRDLVTDGSLDRAGIERFRSEWGPFVAAGFDLHVVTPWPRDLPPALAASTGLEHAWQRIGRDLATAVGDLVTSWQLGNELNIWYFRAPLRTVAEVVRFVTALGSGLRDAQPSSLLGVNAFGVEASTVRLYERFYGPDPPLRLDFIGIDCYWGSWQAGGPHDWAPTIDRVWEAGRGIPVWVCEIGFPSAGELSRPGELLDYLRTLGYTSLEEVERDRGRLLAAAPPVLAESLASLPSESWAEDFEDNGCHLLRKWRHGWGAGAHTPAKQADYMSAALPLLLNDPHVGQVMLFLLRDLAACWTCGRADCPLETSWGFVDAEGSRKPVFSAVQAQLGEAARVHRPTASVS